MSRKNRIRLYTPSDLAENLVINCTPEQAHYLQNVMRLSTGDTVYLFNGRHGEFAAQVTAVAKKQCQLTVKSLFAPFSATPDITLLFAPLKKDSTDFLIQKAVELGVRCLQPVITEYTNAARLRPERLEAQIIEAAEQCRRQDLPILQPTALLSEILNTWPKNKTLLYLDETGSGRSFSAVAEQAAAPAAILVGPEGGFSEKELEILKNLPYTCGITLGKRILRAETAAVAGLSCWQALCGDWQN